MERKINILSHFYQPCVLMEHVFSFSFHRNVWLVEKDPPCRHVPAERLVNSPSLSTRPGFMGKLELAEDPALCVGVMIAARRLQGQSIKLNAVSLLEDSDETEKFAGKLPFDAAKKLQEHIKQSRDEWDM
jgi:hypothetical protein